VEGEFSQDIKTYNRQGCICIGIEVRRDSVKTGKSRVYHLSES